MHDLLFRELQKLKSRRWRHNLAFSLMTLHFPFARFMSFELPLRIPAAACGGVLLCSTGLLCVAATAADVTEKPKQEKAQTAPSAHPRQRNQAGDSG